MKKNPVMELMVKIALPTLTVRFWWTDDGRTRSEIESLLVTALNATQGMGLKDRAVYMSNFSEQIAAIELLDQQGQGVVFYPDWK